MIKFSFDSIRDFDSHINISVPDYGNLIDHVVSLSSFFIREGSMYYDIGCSTGKLIDAIKIKNNGVNFSVIGIDKSENLAGGHADIVVGDVMDFNFCDFNFCTLLFTLQFLAEHDRIDLLKTLRSRLQPGGAIIVCEKTYMRSGYFQNLLEFCYYDYKLKNFSADEILKKQNDLRYIMHPVSEQENISMFAECGYKTVVQFWQSLLFRGWILK